MLAARVEPKNGRRKSKKTGNFKPLFLVQFQPAVDTGGLADELSVNEHVANLAGP